MFLNLQIKYFFDFAEPVSKTSPDHGSTKDSEDTNKFDLKLLMDPVVYTTKLDHMKIFTNKKITSVSNKEDIDKIIAESRPVSKKLFDINIKQEDTASQIDDTNATDDSRNNDDLFTNQESDDEDITVSINSYMLKKPKTRTYNPIQLCKNPDFNTKLRRLAIGFFSSSRNRQLLNACIPMTIDVTKAFESKLVNGTLYLKHAGRNSNEVKTIEIDNQSSTSVVPSALPVQSLLDNSKADIANLIPTPSIDLTPTPQSNSILTPLSGLNSTPDIDMNPSLLLATNVNPIDTERKKIINLPDIDKVRKINQQLLTAQVPPLRVYAGDSYRPPIQSIAEVSNQIVQINPPKELQAIQPVTVCASSTPPLQASCMPTVVKVKSEAADVSKGLLTVPEIIPPEPLTPAKEKLLKIINQAKLTTQEALTKLDGGCSTAPSDGLKQLTLERKIKPKPAVNTFKKHSMYNRVLVPWTPRFAPRPESIDDFLITDDTLNKMLHLMSGKEEEKNCACCSLKQKKADYNKAVRAKKKMDLQLQKALAKKTEEKGTVNQGAQDAVIDEKDSKNPPQNASEKPVSVPAKGGVVKYCCWARQKIWSRKRLTKHMCQPYECVCCCRGALAEYLELKKKLVPIDVSDDEDKSLKMACESIENVVQQSRVSIDNIIPQNQSTSKPKLVIMQTVSTRTESNYLDLIPTENTVGFNQVTVDETEPPKVPPPLITKIIPTNKVPTQVPKKRNYSRPVRVPSHKESLCVPCPCQKPADTPVPQLSIVIDASRNIVTEAPKKCDIHALSLTPIAPKEKDKEKENKILYLRSKSISKTPSECPIFLGKNKILLTTVKFPRKNDAPLQECEAFQAPKIIPTLPLPNGVQLVLLPSGSVSYTLDQGVELTEEQFASLPTIIAAVKEQLESPAVPSFIPTSNPIVSNDGQPLINVLQRQHIANAQAIDINAAVSLEAKDGYQDEHPPEKLIGHEDVDKVANTAANVHAASVNTEKIETEVSFNETANKVIADDSKSKNISPPSSNDTLAFHTTTQPIAESEAQPAMESVAKSAQSETQSLTESESHTDVQNGVTGTAPKIPDGVDESNDKDSGTNRKTLLSDLMEMSGISAEDATAAEPPPITEQIVQEQMPVFLNSEQERSLPELTPVTSFVELKYACENDGKFFKLDFETGIIVPINVCIKKNAKPKSPARVKAVIDLTDDMEDSGSITSIQEPEPHKPEPEVKKRLVPSFQQYVYKGKTVTVPNTPIKPVKLFKAVHPPLLKRQVKLDLKSDSLSPASKRTHSQKRKQTFNKVETVLDLVDSDAPMEEEYLMDSSDISDSENSRTETRSMTEEALEESDTNEDSSDDEPLAKKSKRLKEVNEETDKVKGTIPDALKAAVSINRDAVDPSQGGSDVTKNVDVPIESRVAPKDGNKEETNKGDTQPASIPAESELQSELDSELDPDVDQDVDPELAFMSGPSDNEGGEEDCILGV